jgi:hypothetical protein
VLAAWGARSTFDAEEVPAIVGSVFSEPGDRLDVAPWDGPLTTLSTAGHAASFMRCHGMSVRAAASAAATLDLLLTLTMRGCVVYATKG